MPNIGGETVSRILPNALITTKGTGGDNALYLTFDDGPCPGVTEPLMDLLDSHGAKASFFCIGRKLRRSHEIGRDIVRRGHGLYNHSDTHRNYRRLSIAEQIWDAEACQATISDIRPGSRRIFRAPGGQLGLRALLHFRMNGWRVAHWSCDSLDYQKKGAPEIVDRLCNNAVHSGDILLFHDDSDLCINVLAVMLPQWIDRGFSFHTIETLLSP